MGGQDLVTDWVEVVLVPPTTTTPTQGEHTGWAPVGRLHPHQPHIPTTQGLTRQPDPQLPRQGRAEEVQGHLSLPCLLDLLQHRDVLVEAG